AFIFSDYAISLWGYYFFIFLILLASEIIVMRKIDKESLFWLYTIGVVYFGLAFLGYLTPLFDFSHTTKRGFFKLLPLMLVVMRNNGILLNLSDRIKKWENPILKKN